MCILIGSVALPDGWGSLLARTILSGSHRRGRSITGLFTWVSHQLNSCFLVCEACICNTFNTEIAYEPKCQFVQHLITANRAEHGFQFRSALSSWCCPPNFAYTDLGVSNFSERKLVRRLRGVIIVRNLCME